MPRDEENSPRDAAGENPPSDQAGEAASRERVEQLRIERHAKLCTALPFPDLTWNDDQTVINSLAKLHDYAETLAKSAMDWYLHKQAWKKQAAVVLHWWTYIFGALAAIIPLVMLNLGILFEPFMRRYLGSDTSVSSNAAEAALLLIGIAGGGTLVDRAAGFTTDWMRYITTALRINRALIQFQFDWSRLDRIAPCPTSGLTTPSQPKPEIDSKIDPIEERIKIAETLCFQILDLVGEETSVWVNDLKERVTLMANQLTPQSRP